MEKAKVYFTDFRCRPGKNNLQKLQKLCKKAGIEKINFEGKFVAIKMHFRRTGLSGIPASAVCQGCR